MGISYQTHNLECFDFLLILSIYTCTYRHAIKKRNASYMFSTAQRFNTRIAPKISIFLALHHSLRTSKLDSKIYLMTRYLSLSFCDRKETLLGNSGRKCALLYLISANIHVFGRVKVKSASFLYLDTKFI